MTQDEINTFVLRIVAEGQDWSKCTGDSTTCPVDECILCAIRDCPHFEPLHYHHDGCPACWTFEGVSR